MIYSLENDAHATKVPGRERRLAIRAIRAIRAMHRPRGL
jgi:hypothetical protein